MSIWVILSLVTLYFMKYMYICVKMAIAQDVSINIPFGRYIMEHSENF